MARNKIEDTFTHKFADKFNENEKFIEENLLYEVVAGSNAYGVQNKDSDIDIVSIFMDKHSDLYPQNYGYVMGFDTETGRFMNKELKGEKNRIIVDSKEVEGEWRALTRFFQLAGMKGSPNLVEILFFRKQSIKYMHPAFVPIRDNAPKFISMRSFHAFKGYMYSQFHRIKNDVDRGITENSKRQWMLDEYGYDVKKAYHIVRLMDLLEQMMAGITDIDVMRNKNECKAMRNGEWGSWDDFKRVTTDKLTSLEARMGDCKLPQAPRVEELRNILNASIEEWYGSTNGQTVQTKQYVSVEDIYEQLDRIERYARNGYGVKGMGPR